MGAILRPAFYVPAAMAQSLGGDEDLLESRTGGRFGVYGRLRPGAVTLPCFVLQGGSTRVVPGALCHPMSQGGTTGGDGGFQEPRGKDVWVVPEVAPA